MREKFAVLLALLVGLAGFSQAQEPPPYIYYPREGGYVVERADGSDSHIVGGGLSSAHSDSPSWSLSGQYLAWRSADDGGCGLAEDKSELLHIAGADFTFTLRFKWVAFVWSFTSSDQLFVVSDDGADGARWQILNPAAPDDPVAQGNFEIDSQNAFYALTNVLSGTDARFTARNDSPETAVTSPDGKWAAYIEDGPVMVQRETGESLRIPPSAYSYQGNRGGYVQWHPSGGWLLSLEEGMAGCGSSFHTQITDGRTRYDLGWSRQIEWLPPQVDPALFPVYEKAAVAVPQPFATLTATDWIRYVLWSGDGSALYVYGDYDRAPLAAWDVASGALLTDAAFPDVPDDSIPEAYYQDRRILAETADYVLAGTTLYDKVSGQALFEVDDDVFITGGKYEFSRDGSALIGAGVDSALRIWSIPDGELLFEGLRIVSFALSPDSSVLAVVSSWDVKLYTREALGF